LHYIIPGVAAEFEASTKTIATGCKIMFDIIQTKAKDWGQLRKLIDTINDALLQTHTDGPLFQLKFVPLGFYDRARNSQLWFERIWSPKELVVYWKQLTPIIAGNQPQELYLARQVHQHLDKDFNIETLGRDDELLKNFLNHWFFTDQEWIEVNKNIHFSSLGHAVSFIISDRILATNRVIQSLPSTDPVKPTVIFVGDSVHESYFRTGNGLQLHMLELLGNDDGQTFMNYIVSPETGWKKDSTKWAAEAIRIGQSHLNTAKSHLNG